MTTLPTTRAEAQAYLAELAAATRAEVAAYLAQHGGRQGTLDVRLRGERGWPAGAPVGAVIHVPALWGRAALDTLDVARRFLVRGPRPVSTHLVVGWPDGRLLCCVDPTQARAWHVGRRNCDTVGIDLVSPGPLVPGEDGWHRWDGQEAPIVRPDGSPLLDEDVLDLGGAPPHPYGHRWWHRPTVEQIRGLILALRLVRLACPTLQQEAVVRHADLAPGARVDPGPGVPLELVRAWAWSTEDPAQLGPSPAGWEADLREAWYHPSYPMTALDVRARRGA